MSKKCEISSNYDLFKSYLTSNQSFITGEDDLPMQVRNVLGEIKRIRNETLVNLWHGA